MPRSYLWLRISDEDYELLKAIAERLGLSVAAAARYVVSSVLGGEDCVYRRGGSGDCPARGVTVRDGYVCVDGRAYRAYPAG